jgi:hypothetical protein
VPGKTGAPLMTSGSRETTGSFMNRSLCVDTVPRKRDRIYTRSCKAAE